MFSVTEWWTEPYRNNGESTLLDAEIRSLIQHLNQAPHLKRLWLDNVKMTAQKVMGVGASSLIEHISWAPNLMRLWFYYVKMTPQKVMGAGISSLIEHISWASNLKRLWLHYVKSNGWTWFNILADLLSYRDCGLTMWKWLHNK